MLPKLFFLHFEGTSFVAEDDEGKLVAFLIGFLSQTDPEEAYIHFVGVAPAQRGSGIGRELYERFFTVVAAEGRTRVRCVTSPVNEGSVAFHESLGFVAERRRRGLRWARRGSRALRQAARLTGLQRIFTSARLPSAPCLTSSSRQRGGRGADGAASRFVGGCARRDRRGCGRSAARDRAAARVDAIAARTTIDGVEVGGMSRAEATAAVIPATRRHVARPIRLIGPRGEAESRAWSSGRSRSCEPRSTRLFDRHALAASRGGSASAMNGTIPLTYRLGPVRAAELANRLDDSFGDEPTNADLEISPDGSDRRGHCAGPGNGRRPRRTSAGTASLCPRARHPARHTRSGRRHCRGARRSDPGRAAPRRTARGALPRRVGACCPSPCSPVS